MKLFEMFLLEDRIDFLKQKYADVLSDEQFNNIVQSDPTKNKIYVQWLLNKLNKENPPRFFEDLYKIKEYLDIFDRLKNKFKEKDINKYSFEEFKNDAIRIKNESGNLELKKGLSKEDKFSEYKIGKKNGFDVYKIEQGSGEYQVSCELGSGTEWCTATGKTNSHFDGYNKRGNLYIFINKEDKREKYQLFIEEGEINNKDSIQFTDKDDVEVIRTEISVNDEDGYFDAVENNDDVDVSLVKNFKKWKLFEKMYSLIGRDNNEPLIELIENNFTENEYSEFKKMIDAMSDIFDTKYTYQITNQLIIKADNSKIADFLEVGLDDMGISPDDGWDNLFIFNITEEDSERGFRYILEKSNIDNRDLYDIRNNIAFMSNDLEDLSPELNFNHIGASKDPNQLSLFEILKKLS